MNGPDHYQEAERLLGVANSPETRDTVSEFGRVAMVAEAHVHATLALAAATAVPMEGLWAHATRSKAQIEATQAARECAVNGHPDADPLTSDGEIIPGQFWCDRCEVDFRRDAETAPIGA